MRTLIVDDTRLARRELRTLLAAFPQIDIVGEADDVAPARALVQQLRPELLLLDIQMPGGTGFDLLEQLDHVPAVIFTTAYDQYALRAFEANALDYLLKPIEPQRLAAALARVGPGGMGTPAPEPARPPLGASDRVFVRDGERCWFVGIAEISHFKVDGNYVEVHFRGQKALLARSLSALEERLDPNLFLRANRHALVNLRLIEAIDPWLNEGFLLRLKGGAEVEVSRRQAREFRERLAL